MNSPENPASLPGKNVYYYDDMFNTVVMDTIEAVVLKKNGQMNIILSAEEEFPITELYESYTQAQQALINYLKKELIKAENLTEKMFESRLSSL